MLHLASKSPRRRQLLQQIGVDFSVIEVEVVERRQAAESPHDYVSRVARDKARAGLASLAGGADGGEQFPNVRGIAFERQQRFRIEIGAEDSAASFRREKSFEEIAFERVSQRAALVDGFLAGIPLDAAVDDREGCSQRARGGLEQFG